MRLHISASLLIVLGVSGSEGCVKAVNHAGPSSEHYVTKEPLECQEFVCIQVRAVTGDVFLTKDGPETSSDAGLRLDVGEAYMVEAGKTWLRCSPSGRFDIYYPYGIEPHVDTDWTSVNYILSQREKTLVNGIMSTLMRPAGSERGEMSNSLLLYPHRGSVVRPHSFAVIWEKFEGKLRVSLNDAVTAEQLWEENVDGSTGKLSNIGLNERLESWRTTIEPNSGSIILRYELSVNGLGSKRGKVEFAVMSTDEEKRLDETLVLWDHISRTDCEMRRLGRSIIFDEFGLPLDAVIAAEDALRLRKDDPLFVNTALTANRRIGDRIRASKLNE